MNNINKDVERSVQELQGSTNHQMQNQKMCNLYTFFEYNWSIWYTVVTYQVKKDKPEICTP